MAKKAKKTRLESFERPRRASATARRGNQKALRHGRLALNGNRRKLTGKQQPKLPKPDGNGEFELRSIEQLEGRFHIVKLLKKRLQQLLDETGSESLQQEALAARCVSLIAYCEHCEIALHTGEEVNFRNYISAINAIATVLKLLGLQRYAGPTKRLASWLEEFEEPKRKRKHASKD
jgi:hypothetical protein